MYDGTKTIGDILVRDGIKSPHALSVADGTD